MFAAVFSEGPNSRACCVSGHSQISDVTAGASSSAVKDKTPAVTPIL